MSCLKRILEFRHFSSPYDQYNHFTVKKVGGALAPLALLPCPWVILILGDRVGKNHDFFLNQKNRIFLFKSDFFDLNRIFFDFFGFI